MRFLLLLITACGAFAAVARQPAVELPELSQAPIRIGSFNIQVFGVTKMSKPHVVNILLKTLERYDLVFIMEIRDATGRAIVSLLDQLNNRVGAGRRYAMAISDRLGRTSSKEQYAFFYRESIFSLAGTYQYDDPQDLFERPPYGALFHVRGALKVTTFGVLGLHTSPRDVVVELEALHSVQRAARNAWQNENVLIVGDFNADCTYLNRREKNELQLVRDQSLTWLINSCMETTMVRTTCLYDHIVATGSKLMTAIDVESADVFRFDSAFRLNNTVAEEVSDHYPVELLITGKMTDPAKLLWLGQSLEVSQSLDPAGLQSLHRMRELEGRPPSPQLNGGFRTSGYLDSDGGGGLRLATAVRDGVKAAAADVGLAVSEFRAAFPGVLRPETAALLAELAARHLPWESPPPLPGYGDSVADNPLRLTIGCSLAEAECTARLSVVFRAVN
ncbi:hypothetical protein BOX15_Mlig032793g2 [Macrostomum lignano]|uniref:Endonuclease/exonuclease/phosphatase domain-containing protein n=1 Tax=Macrostomum lignano TaxID=282301 RepID=A0A267DQQ3_9PLAT|nr:hypothetical protein BOX15_Mlig032793g2 [Macrostomum lignano]